MAGEFKNGVCTWCGDETSVYRDNGRCEDCDTRVVYCNVCKGDQHSDGHCRHVFEDQYFQWGGAGTGCTPEANVRASFHDLLDAMPISFAEALRRAIRSGKFYTWIVAPMIGSGGTLELHGMDYRVGRQYGDAMLHLGQCDGMESVADGYHWLASLYMRSTTKANRITMRWIDEWHARRDLLRMADDGCPLHAH